MSEEWDLRDNSEETIENHRIRETVEQDVQWAQDRAERERLRFERRAQRGYFIPSFMDRAALSAHFPSIAEDFNGERQIYENTHGI